MNQPVLKTYVQASIERSIQDSLSPVIDKAVKVAISTTELIVKKVRHLI